MRFKSVCRQACTMLARAALAACLGLASACSTAHPPPENSDPEELAAFRENIAVDVRKTGSFLYDAQRGSDLSEFALGWFVLILLNELASQDEDLYAHLHDDGRVVETYLRNVFQERPQEEIAAITAMSRDGHRTIRLAAAQALEALRQLPDSAAARPQVHRDLIASLAALKALLEQIEREGPDA
jgi:hypothetical protein